MRYTLVLKDAWMYIRQPADEHWSGHPLYVPDEAWFLAVWDPIVDASVSYRKTAKKKQDRKYGLISTKVAQSIATPPYNHFCLYTFLAKDSCIFEHKRPHLIQHRMWSDLSADTRL